MLSHLEKCPEELGLLLGGEGGEVVRECRRRGGVPRLPLGGQVPARLGQRGVKLWFVDWHARGVQPGVPVYRLHSLQTGEVVQEERLELLGVDGLVGEVLVVGTEERLEDCSTCSRSLKQVK